MSADKSNQLNTSFFTTPTVGSVDGGTTSAGDLWHSVSSRWGHSMHTMCSYYGMFPAKVAHYFIQCYSEPGSTVLDPFSGRGTTALQARVEGRRAIANDLNPLAYVLSRAKSDPPSWSSVNSTLDGLEQTFGRSMTETPRVSQDIAMLYHPSTLKQILFLRQYLLSRPFGHWVSEDFMIAGALAGIMHGSWRRDGSSQFLSISMPNTFSMSPAYVAKYIRENNLETIDQNVFERLRDKLARLYLDENIGTPGSTFHVDVAALLERDYVSPRSVDLVVTSPPYMQVVNYGASNWIRLWLLGVEEVGRERGAGRIQLDAALDHRHNYASYCQFMLRTLRGIERVLSPDGVAVVIVGDVKDPGKSPRPLAAQVWADIGDQTGLGLVDLIEDDLPVQNKVSRIWGETKGQATSRDCALVLSRSGSFPGPPGSDVQWDEPWKDGGVDAAHIRLRGGGV